MNWLDLLAVQGTLESLLQHHSLKASILWRSAFFTVQLSHPYMTTGKTIALTTWTFVSKTMSLLFNILSRLVIAFLPRSKRLLISWLQSPSAVILEPKETWSSWIILSPCAYFWLCWVFIAAWAFPWLWWGGAALWLWCEIFSLRRRLLLCTTGSRTHRLQ